MTWPTEEAVPVNPGTGDTVAAIIQSHDWSGSPLRQPEHWPQSLRTTVEIILASSQPMAIAWGPEFAALYNDAYSPILGAAKHPHILGLPMAQVFPETWAQVGPILERVVSEAKAIAAKDQRIDLERNGQRQERYFDFACSPIRDDSDAVGGVLIICTETTERILNERRLDNLFALAPALIAVLRGPDHRVEYANPAARILFGNDTVERRPSREELPGFAEDIFALLDHVYTTGEPFVGTEVAISWEQRGLRREGYFNLSCLPTHDAAERIDGLTIHAVDVTMQVRARQAAEAVERRLAAILEQLPIGVLIAEAPSGQIVQGNARLEAILGHPALPSPTIAEYGEWIGFHPDGRRVRGDEWPLARAVRGETIAAQDFHYQRGDGELTWIRISGAPIHDETGAIVAGVVAIADIAEERAAADALRESEARLQQALQAGGLGSWQYDFASGTITLSAEGRAVIGLSAADVYDLEQLGERFAPETLAEVREGVNRAVVEHQDYAADKQIHLPDGTRRWIAIHGRPAFTADGVPLTIIGTVQEITARKESEEALRDSRRRTEATLEAAEIGTWTWDINNDRVYADRNLATLFGVSPEHADGGAISHYIGAIHPDDQEAVNAEIAASIAEGRSYEAEYRLVRGESIRWVSARGRMEYDETGRPSNLPGVVLDITARKEFETELARLLTNERDARIEAEEAVRARDTFLSIAAHELRTPVTALKGTAQLILRWQGRGQLTEERLTRNLDVLWRSADRLASLTEDLLDVSRIRTGQLTLELHPTTLHDLITEAVGRQREQNTKGQRFQLQSPSDLAPIPADAGRIEQVLTNLLDNAVKYSPDGGTITIVARDQDGGVAVEVRDEGIGLPHDMDDAIFVPFGRASNAATSNLPGMGLGLYICRTIIERHGGWIRAESPGEGLGTTVTFWLPREISVTST